MAVQNGHDVLKIVISCAGKQPLTIVVANRDDKFADYLNILIG